MGKEFTNLTEEDLCDLMCGDPEEDEAEKALKMRTPKKPIFSGDGYWEGKLVWDMAECPTCGNDDYEYGCGNWGDPFCPKCGQALDWSWDEEEEEE